MNTIQTILESSHMADSLDVYLEIILSNLLLVHHVEKVEVLLFDKSHHLVPIAAAERNTSNNHNKLNLVIQTWLLDSHVSHTSRRYHPPEVKAFVSIPLLDNKTTFGYIRVQFDQIQMPEKTITDMLYLIGFQMAAKIRDLKKSDQITELKHELEMIKTNNKETLQSATQLSKELYAVSAIAIKINQSINIEDTLQKSMAKVREIYKASSIVAYLKSVETGKTEIAAIDVAEGYCDSTIFKHFTKTLEKNYLTDIMTSGKPLHQELIQEFQPQKQEYKGYRCFIGVPLRSMKSIIGALFLSLESIDNFGQNNLRLLCGIANIMGMAIENKNLYRQSEMKKKEASFLVQSIAKFHKSLDLEQTLISIAEQGVEFIGEPCCVFLFSETKIPMIQSGYSLNNHNQPASEVFDSIQPKELKQFYNQLKMKKNPVFIKNIRRSKQIDSYLQTYFHDLQTGSLLGIPISLKEKKLGLLLFCIPSKKQFDTIDLSFAHALGNAASIAIENVMAYTASLELSEFLEKKITEKTGQLEHILKRQSIRIENRKDLIFRINKNNRFIFVNKAMETVTGCSREDMYQGKILLDDIVALEDRKRVQDCFQKILNGELPLAKDVIYRHLSKNGKDHFISMTVYPETDQHGVITGLEGVGEDITEKLRLKAELEKTRNLAVLGEFSAAVAHQIRNPLGNILMGVKLMQRMIGLDSQSRSNDKTILDQTVKESLMKIFTDLSEGIGNLNQMVTELLNYTKSLKLNLSSQKIDIILSETLRMFQDLIEQNNITVDQQVDGRIPNLYIDAVLMGQALQNIIHNAIQSMPNGGVIRTITEILPQSPENIMISIRDTGTGIPPSEAEKIFRPFYTTKQMGFGLGLSVAHRIVEAHRGNIWVCRPGCCQNYSSKGAAIHIMLPLTFKP